MSQHPEDMMNFNQKPPRKQKAQVSGGIVIEREDGERERKIYIFPWLQVRITGPRHHLTSSLRSYRRSMTRLDAIYSVFRVWYLGYAAWFGM